MFFNLGSFRLLCFSDEVPKLQSKVKNLMLKLEDTPLSSSTVNLDDSTVTGSDVAAVGMASHKKSAKKKKSSSSNNVLSPDEEINDMKERGDQTGTDDTPL
jgi:hypothetical protein